MSRFIAKKVAKRLARPVIRPEFLPKQASPFGGIPGLIPFPPLASPASGGTGPRLGVPARVGLFLVFAGFTDTRPPKENHG